MVAVVPFASRSHRCLRLVVVATMLAGLAACSDDGEGPVAPEPVEDPGVVDLHRLSWHLASLSVDPNAGGEEPRTFSAQDRVETIRWFAPPDRVRRRYLDPDIRTADGETTVPALELYLRAETGAWGPSSWGGIMCSRSATGTAFPDVSAMAWLDIWVNDGVADPTQRSGRLHVDFGDIDEDFYWPSDAQGNLILGTEQWEDVNRDGVFTYEEDIGLDGLWNNPPTQVLREGEPYDAEYGDAANPFPNINNTARNNREDTEDIDRNGQWDRANSYFAHVIDLAASVPLIDVVRDYDDVQYLVEEGIAWRLYRIPIRRAVTVVNVSGEPELADVRHFRIWLEDRHAEMPIRRLQLAGIRFH